MSKTKLEERPNKLWQSPLAAPPKSHGLRVLDWRSEILQAMF